MRGLAAGYTKRSNLLHDISVRAARGEIIGIIGRNGQGKSTFARCVCGLLRERSGEIAWNGAALPAGKRAGKLYLVMQEPGYQLFADSVEGELTLSFRGKTDERRKRRADALLEQLRLDDKKERHPLALSGGEKQRLSIAAAMMQDAEVVFFDEPTSGLDYANMKRVSELFRELSRKGDIAFVITHDYEFLLKTCSRVLWLDRGTIRMDEPVTEAVLTDLQAFFNINNTLKERTES